MMLGTKSGLSFYSMENRKVVLVTGGTGLVGQAIKNLVEHEQPSNETWIFVGSKDANLR